MSLPMVLALVAMLVLGVAALIVLLARAPSDQIGIAAGALTLVLGLVALVSPSGGVPSTRLLLDELSTPRLALTGIVLVAVFSVLPKRHRAPLPVAALLVLAGVYLALVVSPAGPLAAGLWVLGCGLTWGILPEGPARRLALPYLGASALLGLVGELVGGQVGALCLLLAVAIRLGTFPFHGWVVGAFSRAPFALVVALVAPMAALGPLGRVALDLEGPLGMFVAVSLGAAALWTAAWAIVQRTLSRAVGFVMVSVQSTTLLGMLDPDPVGHLGGLLMWGVTGISLLGLGLVTAALLSRRGELQTDTYSGLAGKAPILASLFLLFGLAAVGAPGTAAFASTDLVLHGSMAHHPATLVLFISAVSVQGYAVLHLFFRVFFGPEVAWSFSDALPRERLALMGLATLLVVVGLAPQILVDGWRMAGQVILTGAGAH